MFKIKHIHMINENTFFNELKNDMILYKYS